MLGEKDILQAKTRNGWWRRCSLKKDRETKEDGRYIIFFTFENEEDKDPSEDLDT